MDEDTPLLHRRCALQLLGGFGLLAVVGCGSDDDAGSGATASTGSTSSTSTAGSDGSDGSLSAIPEETAGPYPGDGTNGPDVLAEAGVVRQDIRSSFGSASGVAEGVDLTIALTVVDAASGDPLPGAAVYLWHCDRDGGYSLYGQGITEENYLRGVQVAGSDGTLSFTSIFPAAYMGRWPHIHFEVYASEADATGEGTPITTSQLALPAETCQLVYAEDGYEQSVGNLSQTSLESDMVFSDGSSEQLATVTGDVGGGFTASLTVPV